MKTRTDETLSVWLKMAKKIVEDDDDCLLLNDKQLLQYINYKIREKDFTVAKSSSYILQHIYYKPHTDSTIGLEMAMTIGEQLREWWDFIHTKKELSTIKDLKTVDNKLWQREKFLLERRFRQNWEESKTELTAQNDVTINIVEDKE